MAALGISLMSVSCGDKNDKESKDADLESQMVGYWAPNVEAMEKEMLKEIGDNPNAAALAPMMTAMLAGMSVEIKKGEVTVHIMGQATTGTYKITKTDADTKTLTMSVEEDGAGFAVALDGRRVKTPAKTALVVPTRALAEAIAAEWDAQEEQIDPLSMPNTRSANAAIDKVAVQFAEVADMLAHVGGVDVHGLALLVAGLALVDVVTEAIGGMRCLGHVVAPLRCRNSNRSRGGAVPQRRSRIPEAGHGGIVRRGIDRSCGGVSNWAS